MSTNSLILGVGLAAGLLSAGWSHAAVLNATYTPVPGSRGGMSAFVNFADEGVLDWALWEYSSSSSVPGTPTSSKADADYIGSAFAVGGSGALRGARGTDLEVSTTPGQVAGQGRQVNGAILNGQLRGSGAGVGLTITVPTTDLYVAKIYVGGYRTGDSPLVVELPGAAPVELTAAFSDGDGTYKDAGILEVQFQADAVDGVANVLEFRITLNPSTDSSSHVLLQGVTLIPEPASVGVLGLTGVALCRRRRM